MQFSKRKKEWVMASGGVIGILITLIDGVVNAGIVPSPYQEILLAISSLLLAVATVRVTDEAPDRTREIAESTTPATAPAAPSEDEEDGEQEEEDDDDEDGGGEQGRRPTRIRDIRRSSVISLFILGMVSCGSPIKSVTPDHAWVEASNVNGLLEWEASEGSTSLDIEGEMDAGVTLCVRNKRDVCVESVTIGFLLDGQEDPLVCWSTLGRSIEGCYVFPQ
jgi:hypothetical protein